MKIAILADIHANLEALEAVLLQAAKQGADQFVVLGDVVGYGADPAACLYRLKEIEATCVLGNHDQALVDGRYARSLNPLARCSILVNRDMVSDEHVEYLRRLAFRHIAHDAAFAHANPIQPEEWQHLFLHRDVVWCLERLDWRLAFVGHTHQPGIFCKPGDNGVVALTSTRFAVGRHRYLINVGSVGQPRDGDWRASYGFWDVDADQVSLHRVEYPLEVAQEKIVQCDLPAYNAERLSKGE